MSDQRIELKISYENLHPSIMERLCKLCSNGKLPTSLLFAGRKGVGKWIIAEQLVRELVCLAQPHKQDCRCAACRQVGNFSHPDVHYLFPLLASEKEWPRQSEEYLLGRRADPFGDSTAAATQFIPLDSVRKFQTTLSRRASLSKVKVGIISEAERMLPATMDSLLKLLEEPPANTHLILLTDKPGLLLPTILSRLQRVNFPALSTAFVKSFLHDNSELTDDQVITFARLAGGSLTGLAELSDRDILEGRDTCWKILQDAFCSSSPNLLIKHGDNTQLSFRDSVEQACRHWQMFLRDMLLIHAGENDPAVVEQLCFPDLENSYRTVISDIGEADRLFSHLERVELTMQELRRNVNPRIAALNLLTEFTEPARN